MPVRVGEIVDVSYNDAMELCGPGFAELVAETEPAAVKQPEPVQVREPVVENRDPGFTAETAPKVGKKRR